MDTRGTIAERIYQLCKERGIVPNRLSSIAAVTRSTVEGILNGKSRNPDIATVKKLCDGLGITLGEFFSAPEFEQSEREIK